MARAARIVKRRRTDLPQTWDELTGWQPFVIEFAMFGAPMMDFTPEEALQVWRNVRADFWHSVYKPKRQEDRTPHVVIGPPNLETIMVLVDDYGLPLDVALRVGTCRGPTLERAAEELAPAIRDAFLARYAAWQAQAWAGGRVGL
jgi:hypothetical protein